MKVLIVYAKAGAGHKRAAEAVFEAFKRKAQEKDVVLIDCLDYTNPWFKNFYPNIYIFLVRFLSPVWAAIYYALENRALYALVKPLRRINNHFFAKRFVQFLKKERPRVVISTQFFASEVVAALKKKNELNSILISVVTDFGAHTFWESEDVDIFVVASEDTKKDLSLRKIPEKKIRVLGIPIEPPLKEFNKTALVKEIGLKQGLFTVLVVGGGFGVGPIKELVFSLNELEPEIRDKVQLLVVCSRNKKLLAQMQGVAVELKLNAKIFGFVSELYKMMLASDVIITKSGGLTTSESLASGLPMIIISPIPGQESKNCDLLVKNGAAIRIDRPREVKKAVEELLKTPDKLEKMRKNAFRLAHPNSSDDIVNLANNYTEGR
ncbi:MAG: glycosyltransferase [Omnitrophica bacterium]|nr:glycosyltransferase [Candidatus Omnitrophota bacterium]